MNPQIIYESEEDFEKFCDRLNVTQKRLNSKLDDIRRTIYRELDLVDTGVYPDLKIVLYHDKKGVRKRYNILFGAKRQVKAFFDGGAVLGMGNIYMSAKHTSIRKLAHEMAHLYTFADMKLPPAIYSKVYEILAWRVELNYK